MVMEADDFSIPIFKIVLVGPSGGGKSSLIKRYMDGSFEDGSTRATVGVDFRQKILSVRGQRCKLMVFDTAGQERFRAMSASYYRGAHGIALVYDSSTPTGTGQNKPPQPQRPRSQRRQPSPPHSHSPISSESPCAPQPQPQPQGQGQGDQPSQFHRGSEQYHRYYEQQVRKEQEQAHQQKQEKERKAATLVNGSSSASVAAVKKNGLHKTMEPWFREVDDRKGEQSVVWLVAAKSDIPSSSSPTPSTPLSPLDQQALTLATAHSVRLAPATSSATGEGVRDLFIGIIEDYIAKYGIPEPPNYSRRRSRNGVDGQGGKVELGVGGGRASRNHGERFHCWC